MNNPSRQRSRMFMFREWGILPEMDYTGTLRLNGVPFQARGIQKSRNFKS